MNDTVVIEAMHRERYKALEDILADNGFWAEQKHAWHAAMAPLARTIFDEGVAFAQTLRPVRRRRGIRGFTDRMFAHKADFLDPDPEILDNIAGHLFETYMDDWWAQLERPLRDALRAAILRAAETGGGTPQVIADLEPWFGAARAQRIGVTETTRLFSQGAVATYQASGIQRWAWQTSEDDHVCDECDALDGQEFDVDEMFDPAHPSCRCFAVPVVD